MFKINFCNFILFFFSLIFFCTSNEIKITDFKHGQELPRSVLTKEAQDFYDRGYRFIMNFNCTDIKIETTYSPELIQNLTQQGCEIKDLNMETCQRDISCPKSLNKNKYRFIFSHQFICGTIRNLGLPLPRCCRDYIPGPRPGLRPGPPKPTIPPEPPEPPTTPEELWPTDPKTNESSEYSELPEPPEPFETWPTDSSDTTTDTTTDTATDTTTDSTDYDYER